MESALAATDLLVLLTVTYTGEPDVVHELHRDGLALTFGRDDVRCDIPIWSSINSRDLSRVAGQLWRMDDEVWVRNLSMRHDLEVHVPGLPLEPPLPPRRDDGFDRGPARSVPGGVAFVRGPGGCELLVRQQRPTRRLPVDSDDDVTVAVPGVPAELLPVAVALCEPLLRGGFLPASYNQVIARAGSGTLRQTRGLVARLCNVYADQLPSLRDRVSERMSRELAQLGLDGDPHLVGGVWRFDVEDDATESDEVARRRALALPDYFEVAHLLVRRHLVTTEHLALLAG